MNTGYIPPDPSGNTRFIDWAKKQHALATRERRMLFNSDALVTQTSDGVILRPKPVDPGGTSGGGDRPVWL